MAKDYYKILDVDKKASGEDIKKAYRKLAVKYHPDKHKGDQKMEEKFKEINEAYAVLGNEQKRKQYDTFGSDGFNQRYSQEDIFKGFDFNNVYNDFGFGKDFFGEDIFDTLFGSGMRQQGQTYTFRFGDGDGFDNKKFFTQGKRKDKPEDAEIQLRVTLEEIVKGAKKTISINLGKGKEKLQVTIPKGIENGKKLRFKGKGPLHRPSQTRGDLYAVISIDKHPLFARDGNDLIIEKEVKLTEMILGSRIRITTINDKTIDLKIPAGTQNNATLRIKGEGVPFEEGKKSGNLLVRVVAILPEKITDEQKRLLEELAATGL
jgi:curved DNA-binding protein